MTLSFLKLEMESGVWLIMTLLIFEKLKTILILKGKYPNETSN
jgi:hypothetical protein